MKSAQFSDACLWLIVSTWVFLFRMKFHPWHPGVIEVSNWEQHHYTNLLSCLLHPFPHLLFSLISISQSSVLYGAYRHKTFIFSCCSLSTLQSYISQVNFLLYQFLVFITAVRYWTVLPGIMCHIQSRGQIWRVAVTRNVSYNLEPIKGSREDMKDYWTRWFPNCGTDNGLSHLIYDVKLLLHVHILCMIY